MQILNNRQEYFEYSALNYSTLKAFDSDVENLLKQDKTVNEGMVFGDALDTFLFDGPEEYFKKFYVMNVIKPTASSEILVDEYLKLIHTSGIVSRDEKLALKLIKDNNLWSNIKDEAKLKEKITNDIWDYIDSVVGSKDKIVIDPIVNENVGKAAYTLKTNEFTSMYFNKRKDVDLLNQVPIVFNCWGREMKAMLDIIEVDHENKTISPTDLKSTSKSAKYFSTSVISFRYDIQAEIYNKAIIQFALNEYPGYKVLPFKFIVISSTDLEKPYVYQIIPELFRVKMNVNRNFPLRGTEELIKEFDWHSEKQLFQYDREMYEKGFIQL